MSVGTSEHIPDDLRLASGLLPERASPFRPVHIVLADLFTSDRTNRLETALTHCRVVDRLSEPCPLSR
eukprot:5670635-Amphidinium_carterae.1